MRNELDDTHAIPAPGTYKPIAMQHVETGALKVLVFAAEAFRRELQDNHPLARAIDLALLSVDPTEDPIQPIKAWVEGPVC